MKWKKYTIQTTTGAEDLIIAMLDELGIQGVEIEDNIPLAEEDQTKMFIDFLPELPPDNGIGYVSFYLEDKEGHSDILKQVAEGIERQRQFADVGEGSIESSDTEDIDWIHNWKSYFHSFSIGDILIKPTWEELKEEDQGKCLIEIDPGISFGTGQHETTQLCIRQLLKYIRGTEGYIPSVKEPEVLDVGCGSGILSIAALKLGAHKAVGIDLDENCLVSSWENIKANHLPEDRFACYLGNLAEDAALQEQAGTECYDIAVANILADVIISIAPAVFMRLKRGGIFITSGIIDFKETEVKHAIEALGMDILEINRQGEWVSITAVKE